MKKKLLGLTMGAVGVVYGDIGTSPLYAFHESIKAMGAVNTEIVFGLLSLIFWTLLIIVTAKYVLLLLRADHNGEGGILALMTLAQQALGRGNGWVLALGMAGAALFYGDAIITPAISVLSAVEGLKLVTDSMQHHVLVIAMVILALLFIFQQHGTARVGRYFGPVMMIWFVVMGWGGLLHIRDRPDVLMAFLPGHALDFMLHHKFAGVVALGSVFLTVTGAEALYADLGHFSKQPIRLAWFFLVMPSLLLNYFGQGALVLTHPEALENPFYLLYPQWAQLPMVLLATLATVIASQAVISGAFSMTHQAMQLGILPRLNVCYTSEEHAGQIYMPQINWLLMAGVMFLIQLFRSSDALASAYGIAVTGTMLITSFLLLVVIRRVWKWPLPLALLVALPLLAMELTFLGANLTKVLNGGYVPLLLSGLIMFLMRTWMLGMRHLRSQLNIPAYDVKAVIHDAQRLLPVRVDGTAIYVNTNSTYAPVALIQNLRHNHILHERNILLALQFINKPFIVDAERVQITELNADFVSIRICFGFMEPPNILRVLHLLKQQGLALDMMNTTFYLSHRHIMPSSSFGMPGWRDRIFIAMANASAHIADFLHLPFSKVVELGVRVTV